MNAEHFIGSIVLNDETELRPQIIDGQQRLTTLAMLLALIRDEYQVLGSQFAGRPQSLLVADPWTQDEARFKLRLGEVNRDLFREFFLLALDDPARKTWDQLSSLPKDEAARNGELLKNAGRLRDLLAGYLGSSEGPDRVEKLVALEEKLSKHLVFVVIRVGSVDDAFLLFETLNDRGLQLSAADLVKSHLLSRIEAQLGKSQVEEAARDWAEVVELLRGADIGRFLRYYLLMYEPKVQMDRVFKLFKKRLEEETAQSLLGHLKTMARYFGEFIQPNILLDQAIRDVVEDINDLRAPTTFVALLPGRHALQGRPNDFVRFARITEALAYRWTTIAGKNAQQLESIFQEAGHLLTINGADALEQAESRLRDAMPSRAEFIDSFRAKRMGTNYVARFTLRRIEEVVSDSNEWMLKSPAKVNIEHIMPQNLSAPWREALGAAAVEIHADSVDRWGNLTLLSDKINKQAQDASFQDKLVTYAGPPGSNIRITQLLQKEKSWGPKEVNNRQRWLAEIAEQIWSPAFASNPGVLAVPEYPFVDVEDEIAQVRILVADNESANVEFKSTARINLHTGAKDPEIEKSVGKTVCAFANAYAGGTLLIGISDDGTTSGIEPDLQAVMNHNADGFEQWLATFVQARLDKVLAAKLAITFVPLDGKTVCRVDIPPSSMPVFFADTNNSQRFYVRVQNGTIEYSGHDLLKYQAERWP
jgi:hypothetical protein